MTPYNPIGQLFMVGFQGTTVSPEFSELLRTYQPGGVILFARNLESPEQIRNLTDQLQKLSSRSPLFLSIDQEGGRVSRLPRGFTIFPPCGLMGQCGSPELAYEAASVTAAELRAVGINMNLAPVLDLNTNGANPIIGDRAFGADPVRVCEMGVATIRGLQDHQVIACGKHFPGHGDTAADSHLELPVVTASADRLHEMELRPFRHAIEHGLATIMTAHVSYPALDAHYPATLSPTILTDLLRTDLRFPGLTLTDDLEMRAILDHYGIEDAAVQAFVAGADILLICHKQERQVAAMEAVARAARDGSISSSRLQASLDRIAHLKARFLHPPASIEPHAVKQMVGHAAHRAVLERILRASERSLNATA